MSQIKALPLMIQVGALPFWCIRAGNQYYPADTTGLKRRPLCTFRCAFNLLFATKESCHLKLRMPCVPACVQLKPARGEVGLPGAPLQLLLDRQQ